MLASPAPLRHHRGVTPDEPDPALPHRPPPARVGVRHGRRRIAHNRSLEGSLAFFGATVVIAALVLGLGADASPLAIAGASGTIALGAAGCELLPLRIDDNLTIPLFVGFTTWIVAALFGVPLG